jgi:hypothetical protein
MALEIRIITRTGQLAVRSANSVLFRMRPALAAISNTRRIAPEGIRPTTQIRRRAQIMV